MFRRRHQIPPWQRLRRWFWPHIGWRRMGIYVVKRATRLSGTPHSIAAGFACGVAISFTPFIGLHLLGSFLLCLLVRGNYMAAVAGTLVGNPWTFPFIWVATYHLGHALLGTRATQLEPVRDWDPGHSHGRGGGGVLAYGRGRRSRVPDRGPGDIFPADADDRACQEARRARRARGRRDRLGIAGRGASSDLGVS